MVPEQCGRWCSRIMWQKNTFSVKKTMNPLDNINRPTDSAGPDHPNTRENKFFDDGSLKVNGRRFKPETTLLVRAPFPLREPFSVQMVLDVTAPNGTLLFYQLAPTKQEEMFVENPMGKQFVLDLINGQIELR